MSWITDILGSGAGKIIGSVGDVIDKLTTTDEEKLKLRNELQRVLQERMADVETTMRAELGAKERVLIAELQQGDNFTKRARPMVVYFGLAVIGLNYCLVPMAAFFLGREIPTWNLPMEFWASWSAIVVTWSIGRSVEKNGSQSKVTQAITGSSDIPSLLK
jgi:hypothetical protein